MENNKKVKLEYKDGKLGFDFQDFFITNPFVSCCMRFEVDPIKEYELTKDQIITPSQDDEGNDAGAIFTNIKELPTIPVFREVIE